MKTHRDQSKEQLDAEASREVIVSPPGWPRLGGRSIVCLWLAAELALAAGCSDPAPRQEAGPASDPSGSPPGLTRPATLESLRERASDPYAEPSDKARYGDALLEASGYREPRLEEAVRWVSDAAAAGAPSAQYRMGLLCEAGQGVPRDLTNAFAWFQKAAAQGQADAQYSLALAYATGSGTSKDREQSVRWFREAALLGIPESAFNLAQRYQAGQGTAMDLVEAAAWFQVSRDEGFGAAAKELALVTKTLKPDRLAAVPARVSALKELCRQKQSEIARRAAPGK